MLTIISDSKKVKKIINKFEKRLAEYHSHKLDRRIIFPQGHWDANVYYSSELGIWWYFDKAGAKYSKRYWNVFGTENPEEKDRLNISCEINMPLKDINLRTAGIWASDERGNIFLLHSGKIGGGTKGVGKSLFLENFKLDDMIDVAIGKETKKYALVAELESPNLGDQVAVFVKEIDRIKQLVKSRRKIEEGDNVSYHPEFSGIKKYNLSVNVVIDSDHGLIVHALKKALLQFNLNGENNQFVDLFTRSTKVDNIFEIKTKISRQVIYCAIGQLKLNGIATNDRPEMFFVCPTTIPDILARDINQLGIHVIKFSIADKRINFDNLNEFFKMA